MAEDKKTDAEAVKWGVPSDRAGGRATTTALFILFHSFVTVIKVGINLSGPADPAG